MRSTCSPALRGSWRPPPAHRGRRGAGGQATLATILLLAAALVTGAVRANQQSPSGVRHGRLFAPPDLGLLEGPDRDAWQQPGRIMDALGIADGATVADVGAGGGWFTIRLARRVGPRGVVYAEDVQHPMIEAIARRVQREGLRNVRVVLGRDNDPNLPAGLFDAVLIVDAYHEVNERVPLLRAIKAALKPSGRLGIVGYRRDGGGPGPPLEDRIDPADVIRDARQADLRFIAHETFLPYQYLLVFGK